MITSYIVIDSVTFIQVKLNVTSHGSYYASPSSGEAYRDRQLTPNFEL